LRSERDGHGFEGAHHSAADHVCRQYGITDYIARMTAIGVPVHACVAISQLTSAERPSAEAVADELTRMLALHA
jgi:hypothetical protein